MLNQHSIRQPRDGINGENSRSGIDSVYRVARITIESPMVGGSHEETTEMNAMETMAVNAQLMTALAEACKVALEAGLSRDDVMAALSRTAELIENTEDE